ncbi:thermonuclease family protein [Chloroflexota bacterium]
MKRLLPIFAISLSLILQSVSCTIPTVTPTITTPESHDVLAQVIRVIDGDTIEVSIEGTSYRVRYIGIDTPETVHPSEPVGCFGKEASDKNKELVEGKIVRLEKDISETDKYERLLRYVWVDDLFVNDYLVREGYAYASTYHPDVKYSQQFAQAQGEAEENNRGLWKICQDDVILPPTNGENGIYVGSINSDKYHYPDCRYAKQVYPENEIWFPSASEAQAHGYVPCKVCKPPVTD